MKPLRKATAIIFGTVILSGCSSLKLYPICFYDKKPSVDIIDKRYLPSLRRAFSEITQFGPDKIIVSPDARWILSRTTPREDRELLTVWPRLACIGPAGSTSQVKLQADCIAYITKFLTERKYLQIGEYKGEGGAVYYNESLDPHHLVYCSPQNES